VSGTTQSAEEAVVEGQGLIGRVRELLLIAWYVGLSLLLGVMACLVTLGWLAWQQLRRRPRSPKLD
jgi:hypothetical protein